MITNTAELINSLTLEELVGQVICLDISEKDDIDEFTKIINEVKPGALFICGMSREKIALYTKIANAATKLPVIIASDIENGPGNAIFGEDTVPYPMAWGACDDDVLIRKMGELTGKICRFGGIHWTFSPLVDLNINFNNPIVNVRGISDSPHQVVKIARSFIDGVQQNGFMAAGAKHFPGDGVDDRNQHFCTTVNTLSKSKWNKTFGYVFKKMIDGGVSSIMAAHIALPCYDKTKDKQEAKPSLLSYDLLTGLLKEKLGFKGCIVSDAMSMIGSASMIEINKLAVTFLKSGGDMVLFPEKDDHTNIINAIKSGELEKARLVDAVTRVIKMKEKVHLFDSQPLVIDNIDELRKELKDVSQQIADKSIKIVRNRNNVLPLELSKTKKVLLINIYNKTDKVDYSPMKRIEEELNKRGILTTVLVEPKHYELKKIMNDYDAVIVNCKISSKDYTGGTLRVGWDNIMPFWRAYIIKHPKFIFVSLGDPYKLYEFPYLNTYINAFSYTDTTQTALVKIIFGEMKPLAKNPVELKGFFKREVK